MNAKGRLETPAQFENIVVRAQPDGSLLRLRDLGHASLGAQDYANFSRLNGHPAAVIIVFLSPGANAVETGDRVLAFMKEAQQIVSRPAFDTTSITTPRNSSALPFAT